MVTHSPCREDDRGVFNLPGTLTEAAVTARDDAREAVGAKRPAISGRFERWAAHARQQNQERFLAESQDVFELERRLRQLERMPYFWAGPATVFWAGPATVFWAGPATVMPG